MDIRKKRVNDLWFTEEQTSNMKLSLRLSEVFIITF